MVVKQIREDLVENVKQSPSVALYRALVAALLSLSVFFLVDLHGTIKKTAETVADLKGSTQVMDYKIQSVREHVEYVDKRVRYLERNPWKPYITPGPEARTE